MKSIFLLAFLTSVCLTSCWARDMIVGSTHFNRLLWQRKAEYSAIPFKKRVKEVFFSDPGQQIIRTVVARDLDQTEASASITAGGEGFSYVNIRLKSERGSGLNYQIEIYA